VVRNALPFDLHIRTHHVKRYTQPRSELLSSQKKKSLETEQAATDYTIAKQKKEYFHNFNLEGEVSFNVNLDVKWGRGLANDYLMNFGEFKLHRDEYKLNEKTIYLEDKQSSLPLELCARIKSTEQTDLEITFYCENCIVNNTDQNLSFWTPDKKRLPGQSPFGSPITLLPGKATKVLSSIQDSTNPFATPSSK
jgi:hypothetical protein